MTDTLADILSEPLPARRQRYRAATVVYKTPCEDGSHLVRRVPVTFDREADGRARPLQRQLPARDIGSPYREVYDLAVAISERTPTHNLCCTNTIQGEVPVTAEELERAWRIQGKSSKIHGHRLCGKFLAALSALSEDQRRVIRRLVALQSPVVE